MPYSVGTSDYRLYILVCMILLLVLGVLAVFVWKSRIDKQIKALNDIGEKIKTGGEKTEIIPEFSETLQQEDKSEKAEPEEIVFEEKEQDQSIAEGSIKGETLQGEILHEDFEGFDSGKTNVIISDLSGMGSFKNNSEHKGAEIVEIKSEQPEKGAEQTETTEPFFFQDPKPAERVHIQQPGSKAESGLKAEPEPEKQPPVKSESRHEKESPVQMTAQRYRMTFDTARSGRIYDKSEIESIIKD